MQEPADGLQAPKGQSLVVIILLGALLAILGATLTRMLIRESRQMVSAGKRDKLFVAGDAAMQRSMDILLTNSNNWNSPENLNGYSSLSGVAFTDIPGLTYYIKIRQGTLEDQTNTGAATDFHVNQWVNVGSLTYDRTIFVRSIETKTGREDRFYSTVHKTPLNFWPGGAPISAGGAVMLAGYDGRGYNSCTPGPTPPTPMVNPPGCVSASSMTTPGPDWDFPICPDPPMPVPTPFIPSSPSPLPFPGKTLVTQDVNYNANQTFGPSVGTMPTVIRYQANDVDFGTKDMTFNASNGPIELYITGTLGMGGSGTFNIIGASNWTCCKSKALTIYIVGGGDITWNGTPNAQFLLYAPESTLTMTGTGNKNLYGALIVKNMEVNGGGTGTFWYDFCLASRSAADNYERPPLITTTWRQIGLKGQLP